MCRGGAAFIMCDKGRFLNCNVVVVVVVVVVVAVVENEASTSFLIDFLCFIVRSKTSFYL